MYWDTSMNDNEQMEQELEEMELNSCAPLCALHDLAQAVSEYEEKKNCAAGGFMSALKSLFGRLGQGNGFVREQPQGAL